MSTIDKAINKLTSQEAAKIFPAEVLPNGGTGKIAAKAGVRRGTRRQLKERS